MIKPLIPKLVRMDEHHRYWDLENNEYAGWSARMKTFEEEFKTYEMSLGSARKHLRLKLQREPTQPEIDAYAEILRKQWDNKREDSAEHGTSVHDLLETYGKSGTIDAQVTEQMSNAVKLISNNFLSGYRSKHYEVIIYNRRRRTAGTTDFAGVRTGGARPVVDLKDYKTNISRGIEFVSKYGKRYKAPLNFLEDCNYNKYAMQLSDYAFQLEEDHGFLIGRLSIIFIPPEAPETAIEYPVPYMREEVRLLNDTYRARYPIINSGTPISLIPSRWENNESF